MVPDERGSTAHQSAVDFNIGAIAADSRDPVIPRPVDTQDVSGRRGEILGVRPKTFSLWAKEITISLFDPSEVYESSFR